ncbi:MAG: hypothetical protein R3B84_23110 [Zavarzinella sp.]
MSIKARLDGVTNGLHSKWLSDTISGRPMFAYVSDLKTWERLHVLFSPKEIKTETAAVDVFPANCLPIAVDLGCNYFVLTDAGAVTYFDYSGFYSTDQDGINVYPVAATFERFVSEIREGYQSPSGSRTANLLRADSQIGGTERDDIWHFAKQSLQCIERKTFTKFFVSEYRTEPKSEDEDEDEDD